MVGNENCERVDAPCAINLFRPDYNTAFNRKSLRAETTEPGTASKFPHVLATLLLLKSYVPGEPTTVRA